MGTSVIEAKLVLSGEDKGASKAVLETVKAIKQIEEASKVSARSTSSPVRCSTRRRRRRRSPRP